METRSTLVLRHTISGETWNISAGRLVVGRKDAIAALHMEPGDLPLALDDALVSRRHAVIQSDRGLFWVNDEGSTDGTYVNDRAIHEMTPIAAGDKLRFGDSVLIGEIELPAASVQSAPRLLPADQTVQYKPAPAVPARQVESEQTEVDTPAPATRRRTETPAPPGRFTPVPRGAAMQQQGSSAGPSAQPEPIAAPIAQIASTPDLFTEAPSVSARARLVDVATALNQLQREAASAVDRFERAGGKQALQSFLTLAARLQGGIIDRADVDAMLTELPTVCRLLELEALLIDMVSTRASDAPR